MNRQAAYVTAGELARRGRQDIPDTLVPRKNLIYSSPATLSFNSPGAEGFGVKRAGLSVPGSVMLVVSPGCCGRNTSAISSMPGYEKRFFYLIMDETDLVSGRHLRKIPQAVKKICASLEVRPSVVMICSTCVDALLGSDMERVCRKAEAESGVRVRPCYMYALTREGSRPPMVQVRQSIYSLLEPQRRHAGAINLLGYFSKMDRRSELPDLLRSVGVKKVRQIAACESYEEFQQMAGANVNLVLDGECREAAADLEKRLGIPSVELRRFYQIDRIEAQYRALGQVLGVSFADAAYKAEALEAVEMLQSVRPGLTVSVGEWANADPFELSLALVQYGFRVQEIFSAPNRDSYRYLEKLAQLSPDTRVYMNQSPSMVLYDAQTVNVENGRTIEMTIGRDAGYYHPECPNVPWASDPQPWGYGAVTGLMNAMRCVLAGEKLAADEGIRIAPADSDPAQQPAAGGLAQTHGGCPDISDAPAGLRMCLTPFAPDQSGAEEVLFSLGAMSIVLDAGGCTGNLCGFDEPRWFTQKSCVMSAGMRDIDAVLGRDKALLAPSESAAKALKPAFTALIGTPVPAVIALDYRAMERMTEHFTETETIGIDTDGMHLYDVGMSKAYMALLRKFCSIASETKESCDKSEKGSLSRRVGVWGCVPLDIGAQKEAEKLRHILQQQGWEEVCLYGYDADLEQLRTADRAQLNLVISPGGLEAARYLKKYAGIPYQAADPLAQFPALDLTGRRVLIVHNQVRANTLARQARQLGTEDVIQASWFHVDREISECIQLRGEADFARLVEKSRPDVIAADPVMQTLIPEYTGRYIPAVHFAVSGRLP